MPATKLVCDSMLGKLSRELRKLGLDVGYARGLSGMRAYQKARSLRRTLITRNTRLRELSGILFVEATEPDEQLAWVRKELGLDHAAPPADQALARCLKCNEPLEKITRDQARPSIPFFIYQIHHDFKRCSKCKQVFWPGSHAKNMARRTGPRPRPRRRD